MSNCAHKDTAWQSDMTLIWTENRRAFVWWHWKKEIWIFSSVSWTINPNVTTFWDSDFINVNFFSILNFRSTQLLAIPRKKNSISPAIISPSTKAATHLSAVQPRPNAADDKKPKSRFRQNNFKFGRWKRNFLVSALSTKP